MMLFFVGRGKCVRRFRRPMRVIHRVIHVKKVDVAQKPRRKCSQSARLMVNWQAETLSAQNREIVKSHHYNGLW